MIDNTNKTVLTVANNDSKGELIMDNNNNNTIFAECPTVGIIDRP